MPVMNERTGTPGLADLLSRPVPPMRAGAPPDLASIRRGAASIAARWPDHGAPPSTDPASLLRKMSHRVARGDWAGCRLGAVCDAARLAFAPDWRDDPEHAALRAFLVQEAAVSTRVPLVSSLFLAYLESFEPSGRHTRDLAAALSAAQAPLPSRVRGLVSHIPELLDPARAVDAVARCMLDMEEPYEGLRELGFASPHAPGLMDHAHLRYIDCLGPRLSDQETAGRLLSWLGPQKASVRRSGAAEAITALLQPWVDREPSEARQSYLTRKLVDMYGDPRRSTGDPWHRVGPAERALFLRWLTGENLRLLFDAITDTNDSHMWEARRQFYLGLHEEKRIDAAWVAFAPAGARRARRILEESGHGQSMTFGEQVAGGTRANTSLLIARIGNKIVVDGSHNYKVHVFPADHPAAPHLFEKTYDCEAIRLSAPRASAKSHNGDWQSWVRMRI